MGPIYEKLVVIFVPCYTYVCSVKSSFQIAALFYMHIDMDGRIAGKQDRPSLIIATNSQKLYIFFHIWLIHMYMKTWSSIVFACCTYVSTVMRPAFADILVPMDVMQGPHDLQKNSKGCYPIASIFDM